MKRLAFLEDLDFRQHLREWNRFVLPIATVVAAILLVVFLVVRTEKRSAFGDWTPEDSARIGLLSATGDLAFDPAFALLSPIEMVLAPTSTRFDDPVGSRNGALTYNANPFFTDRHLGDDFNGIGGGNSDLGDPVFAASDGLVLTAGSAGEGWGNVVTLLHELPDGTMVETQYAHLDSIAVPVGAQVRRGGRLGTIGNADGRYLAHLHFEVRLAPSLDPGPGYSEEELGRISGALALKKWRGRAGDQLAAAPAGSPPPPRAVTFGAGE